MEDYEGSDLRTNLFQEGEDDIDTGRFIDEFSKAFKWLFKGLLKEEEHGCYLLSTIVDTYVDDIVVIGSFRSTKNMINPRLSLPSSSKEYKTIFIDTEVDDVLTVDTISLPVRTTIFDDVVN